MKLQGVRDHIIKAITLEKTTLIITGPSELVRPWSDQILAECTSLQGYRYSCSQLDGGVVRLLEHGLKRSQYVPSCLHAHSM